MMRNLKHNYECEINTNPGERVVERIYSLPKKLQAGIDKAMKNLIEKKYIQKSQSTWVNNIRPVIKPSRDIRVTTNLVALNKLVKLYRYSLPNIDEIIYNLKGKKFFTKLDIEDGVFRIPLAKKDRHKTAFRYKHRLYEWTIMAMGYKNSPSIFQRYMDNVLGDFIAQLLCVCR